MPIESQVIQLQNISEASQNLWASIKKWRQKKSPTPDSQNGSGNNRPEASSPDELEAYAHRFREETGMLLAGFNEETSNLGIAPGEKSFFVNQAAGHLAKIVLGIHFQSITQNKLGYLQKKEIISLRQHHLETWHDYEHTTREKALYLGAHGIISNIFYPPAEGVKRIFNDKRLGQFLRAVREPCISPQR